MKSHTARLLVLAAFVSPIMAQDNHAERGVGLAKSGQETFKGYADRHALVIGIDEYEDASFPDLTYAVKDARAVSDLLAAEYGFKAENIKLLLNGDAKGAALQEALEDWICDSRRVSANAFLFVFYAGHGETRALRNGDRGYLVPADGKPQVWSSMIGMDRINAVSEAAPARHAVFILDCCFGGLALSRGAPAAIPGLTARAREVLTAGTAEQTVLDAGGSGHSVFTQALLDALHGAADANRDRVVTFGELYEHVSRTVQARTKGNQTPLQSTLSGHEGGSAAFYKPGDIPVRDDLRATGIILDHVLQEGGAIYTNQLVFELTGRLSNTTVSSIEVFIREESRLHHLLGEDGEFSIPIQLRAEEAETIELVIQGMPETRRTILIVHDSIPPVVEAVGEVPGFTKDDHVDVLVKLNESGPVYFWVSAQPYQEGFALLPPLLYEYKGEEQFQRTLVRGIGSVWEGRVELPHDGICEFSLAARDLAGNGIWIPLVVSDPQEVAALRPPAPPVPQYPYEGSPAGEWPYPETPTTIVRDTTPPVLIEVVPLNKYWSSMGDTLHARAGDSGLVSLSFDEPLLELAFDGVIYSWDRTSSRRYLLPLHIPADAPFQHEFRARLWDRYDNETEITLLFDVLPPLIERRSSTNLASSRFATGVAASIREGHRGAALRAVIEALKAASSEQVRVSYRDENFELVIATARVDEEDLRAVWTSTDSNSVEIAIQSRAPSGTDVADRILTNALEILLGSDANEKK